MKQGIELETVIIFGELPVPGVEPYLMGAMRNKDIQLKIASIKSIGKIKLKRAASLLLQEFETNNKHTIKHTARALIAIDNPESINRLCVLIKSKNKSIAYSSAYILASMTSKRIGSQVFAIFKKNSSINGPGAYVLGRKKYNLALPVLKSRLLRKDENGMEEMAEAIGWIGDKKSIPLLMDIAQTMPKSGSKGAIWSLGKLKAKESVPLLMELLEKRNEESTGLLVSTLGAIGDERAVMPIVYLIYEAGQKYAMVGGKSLAKIGGPQVVGFIKANIKSKELLKKRVALYTLSKLKDKSIIPFCIASLKENDEETTFNKNNTYIMASLKLNTGKLFDSVAEWKEWYSNKK